MQNDRKIQLYPDTNNLLYNLLFSIFAFCYNFLMKKFFLLLSSPLLTAIFSLNAYCSHISGGDIAYQCLGNNQYKIILNLFRDCSGITMSSSETVSITSSCGTQNLSLSLTNPGGTEISQLCPPSLPNSTCNGGNLPGMQRYTYESTVTLVPCADWKIQWDVCCRNTTNNISNSINEGVWIEANLNSVKKACNTSPAFSAQPIPFVCINQQVVYDFGVIEADGDSLQFKFISARNDLGTNLTYINPYSATNPISGITINPNTGQLTFTPNQTGFFIVVVQCDEYDLAGNWIGSVMRDIQFVVQNCSNVVPSNSGGTISNFSGTAVPTGNYSLEMCDGGNFTFTLSVPDNDAGQTVTLTSNVTSALPGATFTTTPGNPATATISWTAPGNSSYFNSFTVFAQDDACPVMPGTVASPKLSIICGSQSAQLSVLGGNSFVWTSISGSPLVNGVNFSCDTCQNPVASPAITTFYEVTGNLPGSSCKNKDTVEVRVVPDFTYTKYQADSILCLMGTTSFSATPNPAGNYNYKWTPALLFNNDSVSNPTSNSFASPGTQYVYFSITSPGNCIKKDSIKMVVSNAVQPNASAMATKTNVCTGDTLTLQAVSSTISNVFSENFDGINASNWISNSGTVSNSCGSVSGNALYFNTASGVMRQATTKALNLFAGGTVSFYLKIAGAGSFSPCEQADLGEDVVLEYSTNSGATWTILQTYAYNSTPVFALKSSAIPAAAQTAATSFRWRQLTHSGSGFDNWAIDSILIKSAGSNYLFSWAPSANLTTPNSQTTIASPASNTMYIVTVSDSTGTCTDTASVFITVTGGTDSVISFTGSPYCDNSLPQTLQATISGGTWSGNGTSPSGAFTPSVAGTGTHQIIYSYSSTGCNGSDTAHIVVNPSPLPPQVNNQSFCSGYLIPLLSATGSGGVIAWYSDSSLSVLAGTGTNITNITAGNFSYWLVETNSAGCKSNPSQMTITAIDAPVASFSSDYNAASASVSFGVNFVNTTSPDNGNSYLWTLGGLGTTTSTHAFQQFDEPGIYHILLYVENSIGCSDTFGMDIIAYPNPELVFIPNAFTPNGDGLNDYFEVFAAGVQEYRILIFDRWGKLIYQSDNPANPWDGKYNGNKVPMDIYVYRVIYKVKELSSEGVILKRKEKEGHISLIR
jgi:gliding motility-associated-like protein